MKGKRVMVIAAILCIAIGIGAPSKLLVQSPEEPTIAPPDPVCRNDSECPPPVPTGDQIAACLAARCDTTTGTCGSKILTGTILPNALMPSGSECLMNQVVCSDTGATIADVTRPVPVANGERCSLSGSAQLACNKAVCKDGACVNEPDRALKDRECGASENEGCITKTPLCNDRGECVAGASKKLKSGAQCAPPGQLPTGLVLGKPEDLPPSFIKLFTQGREQPDYSCGEDCKLQYCGDGSRNRQEACDGSDLPADRPDGSTCLSTCELSSCEPQPERPIVCRVDPATDSGIEERGVFSTQECEYIVTSTTVARPKPSCSERVAGKVAVRTQATSFVLTDDKKGCRWVTETSERTAPPPECSLDIATGDGIARRPVFSVEQCDYTLGSTVVEKPETACTEQEPGKTATVTTPSSFVKINDSCEWTRETTTITAQPRSCRFDAATGKAYEDLSILSPSCEYVSSSREIPKPAPECIDTGLNDLKFTQATTFNATATVCAWRTDFVRVKKPSREGCSVVGGTGTLTTITLVSDMQAVPPVCRWEESKTVTKKPLDTCDYREGVPFPSWEEFHGMTEEEKADLENRIGKLTYTLYGIETSGCTVTKTVSERNHPQVTSCEIEGVLTRWTAHDSLFNFRNGRLVPPCDWIREERQCLYPPQLPPPQRGGAPTNSAPSQPNPPAANPPPAAPPAAPPAQCNFYTITSAAYIDTPQGLKYSAGIQRSCIENRLAWATRECAQHNPWGGAGYEDDCIAQRLVPGASVILNAQCQVIYDPPAGQILCSSAVYGFRSSPISLIWRPEDTHGDIAFSEFPLFADKTKKVVVWKASDAMPLLVHDPEHTGKISSPHQLFGDHFRGGNSGKAWRDGYEALGSLDSDGEVSGEELKPLALWFDANRDGISQEGEVRALHHAEVDVRKLFYKGGVKDERSSHINLSRGFERMRGGTVEIGASVDWYTEGAETKESLLNKLTTMSRIESGGTPLAGNTPSVPTTRARVTSPLNGAFVWRSRDDLFKSYPKDTPGGAMSFTEYSGGMIRGHLYVETDYAAGGPVKSQIDSVFVHGTVKDLPDGGKEIHFAPLRGSLSGTEFTSTAKLSKDGRTLSGDTSVVLNYNGDVRRFTYSWTAERR